MLTATWLWRLTFSAAGTAGYWLLYRPAWSHPFALMYDVPTLALCFSFAGSVAGRLLLRSAERDDDVRLGLLLAMLCLGLGVEYRGWPFSGHLVCALTSAIMEAADARGARWLRGVVFTPALLLILIRTFRPQSALMSTHVYTLTGVLLGTALGSIGLFAVVRRDKRTQNLGKRS